MTGTTIRRLARKMKKSPSFLEDKTAASLRELGIPFKTQVPLSRSFIVDFVGKNRAFVLEVDGAHHGAPEQVQKDELRDSLFRRAGFTVVRLKSHEVSIERLKAELGRIKVVKPQKVRDKFWLAGELLKLPQFQQLPVSC